MFDLPYILTNPLISKIFKKCAELQEQAMHCPKGSEKRRSIEKRLAQLEQYKLPKPDASDLEHKGLITSGGHEIGEWHSIRRRFLERRTGRPEEYTIKVRAALEEKIADQKLTWRALAQKHGFNDHKDLERAVRRLKILLLREKILPLKRKDFKVARLNRAALGNKRVLPPFNC